MQNKERVFQKKLIERHERQMKMLNRQLHDKSIDSDQNPLATALNVHDSRLLESQLNCNEPSVFDSIQSTTAVVNKANK